MACDLQYRCDEPGCTATHLSVTRLRGWADLTVSITDGAGSSKYSSLNFCPAHAAAHLKALRVEMPPVPEVERVKPYGSRRFETDSEGI